MSSNTHLEGVFSKGYTVGGTALAVVGVGIDPVPGYRIAVSNFCYETNGHSQTYIAFHPVIGTGKVVAAGVAAGESSVYFTGSTLFPATHAGDGTRASNCWVTISLVSGAYQHVYINQYWASGDFIILSTALTASVAGGATCWAYDQASAVGNYRHTTHGVLSATTHVESRGAPGIFYGKAVGQPMVATIQMGTQATAVDYVSGGYISV